VSREQDVVIEVFGEGKADVGGDPQPRRPEKGVVPILLDRLCGKPKTMVVKPQRYPFLERQVSGSGWRRKAESARKQAYRNGSAGAVFVIDSEGDLRKRSKDLAEGRDAGPAALPMAIGVAHPCIEAWLLADAGAIRRAMNLSGAPAVPPDPETLPAGRNNAAHPKNELRNAAGSMKGLSAKQMTAIAKAMNNVDLVRIRCPLSFAPFADEVHQHIRPLF